MICYKLLLVLLLIWMSKSEEVGSSPEWGDLCPVECECKVFSSPDTSTRWSFENTIKTAICLFRNESLFSILALPQDTESITILQANDDTGLTVNHNTLKAFKQLKSIDFQGSLGNASISISNDIFHNLDDLRHLSLQRVNLAGAEKVFSKLATLEVLHVIHCDIGYLKWEMLDGMKNLRELYLLQSGIKELYGFAFYGTPELRRLFLSHNDLFSVEADAFVGLLKLEYLDLSNNHIEHLSGLTFPPLPHLQWLDLKHNPIKVIFPHCFQFLNGTQHLTLGHKKQPVHLMKFSFRGLYSLLYLHIPNIDNDALFEHMFYDLKSLKHMNLRGRVKLINNRAFNGAHKVLTKLVLRDCKLEKLFPDSFYGLENLIFLDLSENQLQSIPDYAFNHLKKIENILLNDNHLKQVSSGLFLPLQTLKATSLYNNPWNCTCNMRHWRSDIIMSKYIPQEVCQRDNCTEIEILEDVIDFTPKCEEPKPRKGESVFHVVKGLDCQ